MPTPASIAELDPLRLLTVPEAADATGLEPRAIRHLIAMRRVPVVRLGRSVKLRRADLAAVIEAATTPARAEGVAA